MNMKLLMELKHRIKVSGRWKWEWHARIEMGKSELCWGYGCERQIEGLL